MNLKLAGVRVADLLDRVNGSTNWKHGARICLTTNRDGENVLHYEDECRHGTHLSRPCHNCERGDA